MKIRAASLVTVSSSDYATWVGNT